MKEKGLFFYLIVSLVIMLSACSGGNNNSTRIMIDTRFDHGSLGQVKIFNDSLIKGQTMHWIKKDKNGNQYYWFYFKIFPVKDKNLTFEFDNMTGIYRGMLAESFDNKVYPVISYDNSSWKRIADVSYYDSIKQYKFKHNFTNDTAWIAFSHPYSLSRHLSFTSSVKNNKHFIVSETGKSTLQHQIINIKTRNNVGKKNICMIAMQHAGEDAGGFFMEGLINFLGSDDPIAEKAREKYAFHFFPMVNPDGCYMGITRYSSLMGDLNSQWSLDDNYNSSEPEVWIIKNYIEELYKRSDSISLFIDIHCHGQRYRDNRLLSKSSELEILCDSLKNYWPIHYQKHNFASGASAYAFRKYAIPAGTLELSQSVEADNDNYLRIMDYQEYGKDFVYSLIDSEI